MYDLAADRAVINRFGFNNDGHDACLERLQRRRDKTGLLGVNIGANKDSADRVADYVAGIRTFGAVASYFTVNISSPNTPGLRDLQAGDALTDLLARVIEARDAGPSATPVFVKIAPDLDETAMDDIAAAIVARRADGLIVSNTTLARDGLSESRLAGEAGGMSGRPLFERSTAVLARMRQRVGPDLPIISVGGIDSAETALEKMRAGADLVQLYSGMVFEGPSLPARILAGTSEILDREGLDRIATLRDTHLADWAQATL